MSGFSSADTEFMQKALDLARKGLGLTSPNPMVGAIIVKDGKIVGQGFHPQAGEAHAEIFALREAGDKAREATLYVTLEPCNHHGKTPPCTEAVIQAGIRRVVFGCDDPNPRVDGHGADKLKQAGIQTENGLLENECRRLNEAWNKYITTGLPFVTLKSAASLDGRIATRSGHSQWITNEKSRLYAHQLRFAHDAILVGIGTLLKDNPRLTARCPGQETRHPYRIVVDSMLRTPLHSLIFGEDGMERVLLATTQRHDQMKLNPYRRLVKDIICLPTNELGQIDLRALMREIASRNIISVLIEGGSEINGSAVDCRIVDKICFFYAPILIGGRGSLGMISGTGIERIDQALPIRNITIKHFDDDLCLEGYLDPTAIRVS
ncbi:MAG: bifunctional diaminohydroxyphosphoribosylaminopyrimidine deaminase/5-amino-6-(5-phosphoribosylamino)uracil reductase RibD [Deltaproteobacteria bacterium]|nr:bifunctional diaminohydroxyphosphoribosylaminopyrimidine deaminase/5-amino-6-(5-phosphoribosylamino)uracil reductase RibD [Deltaproteobacteria bacterium]